MASANKQSGGFTIVELLIVIIVVSILAATTVVAFNGVRERASNVRTQSAAQALEKALKLHYQTNGSALKVASAWFHVSLTDMAGVCIGSEWPSDAEMQNAIGTTGYSGYTLRALYCGWYWHSSISIEDATQQMNDALVASTEKQSFPKMPTTEAITVSAVASNGSVQNYTIRSLRYAYNNSSTNPTSYIYYVVYGKTCFPGDSTVRLQDTMWTSSGGSEWNGTFTTGGDYTANNTASCIRQIKWQ